MGETNYNIGINFQTNTEQSKSEIKSLMQTMEELAKTVGKVSSKFKKDNATAIEQFSKEIQNSTDKVAKANEIFASLSKQIDKVSSKKTQAVAVGDTKSIAKYSKELSILLDRQKAFYSVAKSDSSINQEISSYEARQVKLQQSLDTQRKFIEVRREEVILAQQQKEYEEFRKLEAQSILNIENQELTKKEQLRQQQEQLVESMKAMAASDALQKFMLSLDPTKQKLAELSEKMNVARGNFIELKMAGENTKSAEDSIKRIKKQMDKLQESTQKSSSWVGKLMGRIRNISIYRMIRSGIKWLTSGVSEGIKGLAQYSGDVNSTLSNLKNSLGQIRNTLAISFASVLQTLEPLITKLSDMLVDLVNSFNLAMAKMQGKNVYTKAKKAADDYAKSAEKARKLSFDTFEVLSGGNQNSTKDLFEEGSVTEDANELSEIFSKIFKIIKQIWGIAKKIIDYLIESKIIDSILSIVSPLLEVVSILIDFLQPILLWLGDFIGTLSDQISGALSLISGLLKICTLDFKNAGESILKGLAKLAQGIINMIIDALNVVITLINAIIKPIDWIASLFGAKPNTVQIPKIPHVNIGGYETGGIPSKSELFYMNENGVPEALVNTGGSQTNVINIDQLSEGMRRGFIQAIYDTDLIGAIREQSGTTLMVDKDVLGSTVASSAGFRNEMNRRNANLNLI